MLESAQLGNGRWLDFRREGAISSQWVTAYVATSLAQAGGSEAAVERARVWLLGNAHRGGGWGFSLANPVDADSTANVLRLLSRWREDDAAEHACARAAEVMLRFWAAPDGGFRTYLPVVSGAEPLLHPSSAWCDEHLSVTAMAALALHAVDSQRHGAVIDACVRYVRGQQAEDGFWEDYWWEGRTYATSYAAHLLSVVGDDGPVARAGAWLARVRAPEGGWSDGLPSGPAPFPSALALSTLALSEAWRQSDDLRAGVDWLLRAQEPDGGWPSVPVLRMPSPDVHAPWAEPAPLLVMPVLADRNRLFTTATALSALVACRDSL